MKGIGTEDEDPRFVKDLIEENQDLQEQYLLQLKNLERYAEVAKFWWHENCGD